MFTQIKKKAMRAKSHVTGQKTSDIKSRKNKNFRQAAK